MNIYQLDAVFVGVVLALFIYDRFAWLNRTADALENNVFTGWLHYNVWGDPATWLQHGLTAATVSAAWGLLGLMTGTTFPAGYLHGACGMLGFYAVREGAQAYAQWREGGERGPFVDNRHHPSWRRGLHVGWFTDGLMDLMGPLLVLWLARSLGG